MRTTALLAIFLCITILRAAADGTAATGTAAAPTTTASGTAAAANTAATGTAAAPTTTASGTAAAASASAAPAAPIVDTTVPKDAEVQWTVGFSVFSVEGLSAENSYLAYSVPLLLKDEVSVLDTHAISATEMELVRKAIISREVAVSEKAITAIYKERDALLFSDTAGSSASGSTAKAGVEARLAAAITRLSFLQALDPSQVDVAAVKPVSFKEGTGAGKLLDSPLVPADIYCARQGLDLLIGGSVQELQGYILLDIWAFDATRGRIVFSSRNAAQRDELYASLPSLGKEIAETILGHGWSLVTFAPDPPESSLYVDGNLAVSGASPALYLSPGPHEIKVSAPGYSDLVRSLTLGEGEETRIADTLEKQATGSIALFTDPVGADLYLGSIWKGKTPLLLDLPSARSRGVLSLTGFYDQPFSIDPTSPLSLSVPLQQDTGPRDALQKKTRDAFYVSLGWFAFSIPLPLFSYALAMDYSVQWLELLQSGAASSASTAQTLTYTFLGTYYAGIAISVSLFAWMVSRIITYVTASNRVGD
ncbi:MAG: PEGA domain-containing protein [Spirochaetia bacterium]|jgi:hypothetical protein